MPTLTRDEVRRIAVTIAKLPRPIELSTIDQSTKHKDRR
jgi:hypothetical protein